MELPPHTHGDVAACAADVETRPSKVDVTPSGAIPQVITGKFSPIGARRDTAPTLQPVLREPPPHPLSGIGVEELELLRPVGAGGIAELWLARHPHCDTPFVVKLARQELANNPHVIAQFEREWRATRLLTHPGIIPHYSQGMSHDGRSFLTMEHVVGRPLTHFVKCPARWKFLRAVLTQLCEVLEFVHEYDVLHQDLKPGNIMLDLERRRVRLTDFGLARFDRAEPGSTSSTVLGTPAYMAPEQARGYTGLLGPATEMYTVGVLIYELLSGQKPFSDRNDRAVMIKHCKAEPPPLRIRKGIDAPVGIRAVVERLLAKTPEERYPNAAALKQALLSLEANTAQPE